MHIIVPDSVDTEPAHARALVPPTIDVELALHLIQGPLISRRVIDARPLTEQQFDQLLAMTLAGLAAGSAQRQPPRDHTRALA